jgi:hypothetical protein
MVVTFWLTIGIAVSVKTAVRPDSHTVFPVLAQGATHWWHDQPLYGDYKPLDFFRYPPFCAVALTPFALLGGKVGGILWTWLSLACYATGLWHFLRLVLPVAWSVDREALFMALGLLGALRGFWNGQSNAPVVGLLLMGAAAVVEERWWLAALLLAVAVHLKLTPLAPALLLCAVRPRRLAWPFGVTLMSLALVPFLTRAPHIVWGQHAQWASHLLDSSEKRWLGFRDAWTVWQVLRQSLGFASGPLDLEEPLQSSAYRVVQLGTVALSLLWCLWQRRRLASRELVTATLSMGMAWLLLFGPAVEHPTYVFLAPSLAWCLLERADWPGGRWVSALAGVLILVLGWGAFTRPLAETLVWLWASLPLGAAVFLIWLVIHAKVNSGECRVGSAHS